MAKSNVPFNPSQPRPNTAAPSQPVKTEVRGSPIPKVASAKIAVNPNQSGRQVSRDQIARRAYEIWQSGQGGSEFDNWIRAERELRGS